MIELIENDDRNAAQWRLDRFVRQFGPEYRSLVQVAAVPIVLTPELVGYLRGQFLPDVSWVAEADLLLSELCRSVGYERYVMDSGVQSIALQALDIQKPGQVEEIARVLVGYVQHLARVNPYLSDRQRKHQQWAAMLCITELRGAAIEQMAVEFAHWEGAILEPGNFGAGRSEMAFFDQVLREQRSRLLENAEYLKLATRVSQAMGRMNAPIEMLEIVSEGGSEDSFEIIEPTIVPDFPPLQMFEFETVTIEEPEFDPTPEEEVPVLEWRNKRFGFDTAKLTIEEKKGWFRSTTEVVITKGRGQAVGYVDRLSPTTELKMIAIPGGKFLMGAPKEELETLSSERPQHSVTVPEFWMGQTQVTQAQWKTVAELPQVNIKLDPDPSRSKKHNLPVEQVSWDEAVEFCDRLSIATGRTYRLPSEAQWEYACRAGTTTPFHFGETIDAELANYQAQDEKIGKTNYPGKYGKGRFGTYRKKTTPVGTFPASDFGLYDMHGNVWEWCSDDWHKNYEGAPIDGSVWDASNDSEPKFRLIRGGSWGTYPFHCRSAYRYGHVPAVDSRSIGFRVVCLSSRELS